jgi:ParB/RepB/Spo0J family partition protein
MSDLSTDRILLKLPLDQLRPSPFQRTRANAEIEALAASINDIGLTDPIIVVRDGAPDTYYILAGHCRVEAVKSLGWETIDAQVWPNDWQEKSQQAHAILAALATNTQRSELTDIEKARFVQGALDLGISEERTAKALNMPAHYVPLYRKINNIDDTFADTLTRPLTLFEAEFIVEFSDEPETISTLTEIINNDEDSERFIRKEQRARNTERLIAAETTLLQEQGITVVSQPKYSDSLVVELETIGISEANHRSCDGHAAYVWASWDDEIGHTFVCTDAKKHHKYKPAKNTSPHQQQEADKLKAGREFKKEGLIDYDRRLDFVKVLLDTTKDPLKDIKGVFPFLAYCLAHHIGAVHKATYEMLGKKVPMGDSPYDKNADGTPKQVFTGKPEDFQPTTAPAAVKVMIALACAHVNEELRLAQEPHSYRTTHAPVFLSFLTRNGYKISSHEQQFLDAAKQDVG